MACFSQNVVENSMSLVPASQKCNNQIVLEKTLCVITGMCMR